MDTIMQITGQVKGDCSANNQMGIGSDWYWQLSLHRQGINGPWPQGKEGGALRMLPRPA